MLLITELVRTFNLSPPLHRMGDLTGYAPNVVSTTGGGLQQLGAASNDPRQVLQSARSH